MKITIRFSIASITLFLLITVSALIVGVGYIAINKILIAAVSNNLNHESKQACRKISSYLLPLDFINKQVSGLLNNDIIKPEYPEQMINFLHSINDNEKRISGVFWWNTFEDFWYVNNPEGEENIEEIRIFGEKHGNKTIQKLYDKNKHVIKINELNKAKPYEKPWAQKAITTKKTISVIFSFAQLGSQKKQLGIVSAYPFYDKNGSLVGIFGVEMLIKNIAKYINAIKATKNSRIFVINDIGETMDELRNDATILDPTDKDVQLKQNL